jgi:hypothetical protein
MLKALAVTGQPVFGLQSTNNDSFSVYAGCLRAETI